MDEESRFSNLFSYKRLRKFQLFSVGFVYHVKLILAYQVLVYIGLHYEIEPEIEIKLL